MLRAKRSAWAVQRAVVFALLLRELKTRLGGRWLGVFWLLLEPLAYLLLQVLMFSTMHAAVSPSIEYPVFLITGMLPFLIFRSLMFRLMDGIDANRGLFGYRQVKPIDTLVSRGLLEIGLQSIVYLIALATLGWFGYHWWPAQPLELIAVSIVLITMGASLGLLFAVLTNDVPQLRAFVRITSFPLYLLSGVILSVHALPPELQKWLLWNPVLHLIELSRHSFFPQYPLLAGVNLGYPLGTTVVVLALALSLYRVRRDRLIAA
jgi:capsular polysaccharide transport system permease protein